MGMDYPLTCTKFGLESVIEMEKHSNTQFLLTGSSARKLKHGAGNLLGGRAFHFQLNEYLKIDFKMSNLRTEENLETDLIIERPGSSDLYLKAHCASWATT